MNLVNQDFLVLSGEWMPYISLGWISLGIITLIQALFVLKIELNKLNQIEAIAIQAKGSDHNDKIRLRAEIVQWIDKSGSRNLQRWVYTVHNSALAGGLADASALTDAVWSQERERFRLFKYLCRYSVMVGLLFTSAGLCLTLMSVGPALQASGLDPDNWMKAVQTAMASALGGMSTAFYSSLYAIFTALILNLLGLIFLYPFHDYYLSRMDAFIQGNLVPIFTAIVEKDRNDVIAEVMEFTDRAFREIQKQYSDTLVYFKKEQILLEASKQSMKTVADQLTNDINGFSKQVINLSVVAQSMASFSEPIAEAIDEGLDRIEQAQTKSNEQFASMQQKIFDPFIEGIKGEFQEQRQHTKQVFNSMNQVSQQITLMTNSLMQMTQDVSSQAKNMAISNASTASSIDGLKTAMEELVKQQGENMSEQTESLVSISEEQSELVQALKEGVDSISLNKAQMADKINDLFAVHTQAVESVYNAIQDRLGSTVEQLASESLRHFHEIYNQGLEKAVATTHEKLTGLQILFDQLIKNQTITAESVKHLTDALKVNEDTIKKNAEAHQNVIEDFIRQFAGVYSNYLEDHSEAALNNLNQQIQKIFDASLLRQEKLVEDLNGVLGKKWDDFISIATSAVKA